MINREELTRMSKENDAKLNPNTCDHGGIELRRVHTDVQV